VNQSYFIRAEGKVKSLDDIENIVVKNGTEHLCKKMWLMFALVMRTVAITGNGEGEKVLGQVMMLKGANSKQVINDVKVRIAEIKNHYQTEFI
jgi:cobalt-zinc-cadmium resistance protein CzcA